ncbi:hypothetical protein Leryth_010103 [Lithospermum erythrorhizon]|nr:hypothetical protein Leryth_010103 [Lithospermum erythrorhizon]
MICFAVIRGECGREGITTLYQKLKEQDARDKLDQQLRAVVQIQSGRILLNTSYVFGLDNLISNSSRYTKAGWHIIILVVHSSRIKEQKLKEQDDHNKLVQHISAVVQIQSSIRGWLERNHFGRLQSSKNLEQKLKKQDALNKLNQQLRAAVQIQSGIRGCLARNQLGRLQSSRKLVHNMNRVVREISEVEDLPKEVLTSIIEELHRRVGSAEDKLSQKEKENTALREKVQQLKAHRSEYKANIKSMEGKWKKEKESLKLSLLYLFLYLCRSYKGRLLC